MNHSVLKTKLKSLNLPTKVLPRSVSASEAKQMSDNELLNFLNRERAKLMLLRQKSSTLQSDLKKSMRSISSQVESLERQKMNIEFSQRTPTTLKKKDELTEKLNRLRNRSLRTKERFVQRMEEISRLVNKIEKNLEIIEKVENERLVRR